MGGGLSLSPFIVGVRVVGWWSLSLSLSPSIVKVSQGRLVKVRLVGWWSLSVSFYRLG